MARRYESAAVMVACLIATFLAGLHGVNASTGGETSGFMAFAEGIATAARDKILECSGAEPDSHLPLIILGAMGAALVAFTLYLTRLCFDRDPYVFNGGKMGKLEAQSVYTNKKRC
ncbi:unnamed protein product [Ectocarpus sp. 6 AP-2014]